MTNCFSRPLRVLDLPGRGPAPPGGPSAPGCRCRRDSGSAAVELRRRWRRASSRSRPACAAAPAGAGRTPAPRGTAGRPVPPRGLSPGPPCARCSLIGAALGLLVRHGPFSMIHTQKQSTIVPSCQVSGGLWTRHLPGLVRQACGYLHAALARHLPASTPPWRRAAPDMSPLSSVRPVPTARAPVAQGCTWSRRGDGTYRSVSTMTAGSPAPDCSRSQKIQVIRPWRTTLGWLARTLCQRRPPRPQAVRAVRATRRMDSASADLVEGRGHRCHDVVTAAGRLQWPPPPGPSALAGARRAAPLRCAPCAPGRGRRHRPSRCTGPSG